MVTGDHPRTAAAIGAAIGLGDGRRSPARARRAGEDELARADIYARVAPEHKLRLVRALQARGEVVAVTGDGVNDAPALRQADIGVAMGRGGTAAAKEAADMVLADDDFSTLRAAVEEGRRVYDNLVKALSFVLPTSVGQALIIAVAVLAFPPTPARRVLPVEPVQILWINLIVAVALALPLAFEAAGARPHDAARRATRRRRCSTARCSCARWSSSVTLTRRRARAVRARPPTPGLDGRAARRRRRSPARCCCRRCT